MRAELLKYKFNYFDIHCHAYEYQEEEIQNYLKNKILIFSVSEDFESIRKNLEIVKKYDLPIFIGIHPWNAHKINFTEIKELENFLKEKNVVGIGEVGLDKVFFPKTLDKQKEIFIEQIKLAKEYDLPLNLHSLNALKETLELIVKFDIKKANFHWISYSSYLEEIKNLGYFCSFNITIKFKENHRKALEVLDIKNILTESDGPYKYKNVEMRSSDVVEVVKEISKFYNKSEKSVISRLKRNLKKFIKP